MNFDYGLGQRNSFVTFFDLSWLLPQLLISSETLKNLDVLIPRHELEEYLSPRGAKRSGWLARNAPRSATKVPRSGDSTARLATKVCRKWAESGGARNHILQLCAVERSVKVWWQRGGGGRSPETKRLPGCHQTFTRSETAHSCRIWFRAEPDRANWRHTLVAKRAVESPRREHLRCAEGRIACQSPAEWSETGRQVFSAKSLPVISGLARRKELRAE